MPAGESTISPTCFSTNATAYLNAFMVNNPPNTSANELVTNYSQLNNFRQDIIRLDQNIGDRVRLFGRYMEDVVPENPFGLWGGELSRRRNHVSKRAGPQPGP